jgi:predicted ArsR family transcriptional regulator
VGIHPPPSITQEDLLAALGAALPEHDQEAWTARELASRLDVAAQTVLRWLRPLVEDRRVEVTRKFITRMDGHPYRATAYRVRKQ